MRTLEQWTLSLYGYPISDVFLLCHFSLWYAHFGSKLLNQYTCTLYVNFKTSNNRDVYTSLVIMIDACVVPEKNSRLGWGPRDNFVFRDGFKAYFREFCYIYVNSINLNFLLGSGSPRPHSSRSAHEMIE